MHNSIDTIVIELLVFCAAFSAVCGTVVVKVECPDDEKLRKMITKKAPGEQFEVQCSKPMPKPGKVMNEL